MRRWLIVLVAAAGLTVAACGDDSGTGSVSASTDPSEQGAIDMTVAMIEAVYRGDWATVRSGLSDRCQEEYPVGELAVQMEFGLSFAAGFMGMERSDFERIEVGEVEVFEFTEGESATIGVETLLDGQTFASVDEDPAELVFVDGRWQSDDCDFDNLFENDE